jgi:hypothetical protein
MSLRQHRRLPFVKHKQLPERFILLPLGYGEGRYGLYLKGHVFEDKATKPFIKKEWKNGINFSLTSDSIEWLIAEGYDNVGDLIKEGAEALAIEFLKDEKGYAHIVDVELTDILVKGAKKGDT